MHAYAGPCALTALLLFLSYLRVYSGTAIFILSAGAALIYRIPPQSLVRAAADAACGADFIKITSILLLIRVINKLLTANGTVTATTAAFGRLLSGSRLLPSIFPALGGLFPMPGGVLLSSPYLSGISETYGINRLDQGLINYWFRHICEFIWPLYPGIALASVISGTPLKMIILWQAPFALLWAITGWHFFLKRLKPAKADKAGGGGEGRLIVKFLFSIALFFTLMLLGVEIIPMLIFSIAAVSITSAIKKKPVSINILGDPETWRIVFFLYSVFLLRNILNESGFFSDIIRDTAGGGPGALLILALIVPALIGFFSGVTLTTVGVSFPIVQSLGAARPSLFITTYLIGYLGTLASPLHLCLTITAETAGEKYFRVLRGFAVPLLINAAAVLAFFLAFQLLY